MNKDKQRIAIAEACGWKSATDSIEGQVWKLRSSCWHKVHQLPDYLNDLNAIHDAENFCSLQLGQTYAKNLRYVIDRSKDAMRCETWIYYCATAAQRAEAFLRTLGLWKEEEYESK